MKKGVFFAALLLLMTGGCAPKLRYVQADLSIKGLPQEEETLLHRAMAYREALSAGDLQKAYQFELPYQRYTEPFDRYKAFHAGDRHGYRVLFKTVKIDDSDSEIGHVTFQPCFDGECRHSYTDTWYRIGGTWYHRSSIDALLPTPHLRVRH